MLYYINIGAILLSRVHLRAKKVDKSVRLGYSIANDLAVVCVDHVYLM